MPVMSAWRFLVRRILPITIIGLGLIVPGLAGAQERQTPQQREAPGPRALPQRGSGPAYRAPPQANRPMVRPRNAGPSTRGRFVGASRSTVADWRGQRGPRGWAGVRRGPGFHGFHRFPGRDVRHFSRFDRDVWRRGAWRHGWHRGRFGWWWFAGGAWYLYPQPVYPYPLYVSNVVYVEPTTVMPAPATVTPGPVIEPAPPPTYWYYCDDPAGYYPYVARCNTQFRPVMVAPPTGR